MNVFPVLMLTRNCLELTRRCYESLRWQDDVSVQIHVYDNGSTDGTAEWLCGESIDSHGVLRPILLHENTGVSVPWNRGLNFLFKAHRYEHVLVINNDTLLQRWFCRELLSYDVPFVTGVAVDDMNALLIDKPERCPLTPHPDFSAFLIRREVWEKIGPFDESMRIYCSDCDYHIRGHRLGVPMMKANVPYFHINSQTLKRADPTQRAEIKAQADRDREVFRAKYNCLPGTPEYAKLFE